MRFTDRVNVSKCVLTQSTSDFHTRAHIAALLRNFAKKGNEFYGPSKQRSQSRYRFAVRAHTHTYDETIRIGWFYAPVYDSIVGQRNEKGATPNEIAYVCSLSQSAYDRSEIESTAFSSAKSFKTTSAYVNRCGMVSTMAHSIRSLHTPQTASVANHMKLNELAASSGYPAEEHRHFRRGKNEIRCYPPTLAICARLIWCHNKWTKHAISATA